MTGTQDTAVLAAFGSLTPDEIRHARPRTVFGGYDRLGVERFLADVAAAYEDVLRERDRLSSRVAELEASLEGTGATERLLAGALVSSQRAATELKERARKERERTLEDARARSREIRERALAERENVRASAERQRAVEAELRARYREVLTTALERLDTDLGQEVIGRSLLDELKSRRSGAGDPATSQDDATTSSSASDGSEQ